jgi:hypothetical protein
MHVRALGTRTRTYEREELRRNMLTHVTLNIAYLHVCNTCCIIYLNI